MFVEFLEVQSFDFVVLIVFRQDDIKEFDLLSSELILFAIIIELTKLGKILLLKHKILTILSIPLLILLATNLLELLIPLTILLPLPLILPNNHLLPNILPFLILIFPINHLVEIALFEIFLIFGFLVEDQVFTAADLIQDEGWDLGLAQLFAVYLDLVVHVVRDLFYYLLLGAF
jgi:hypothetical protein